MNESKHHLSAQPTTSGRVGVLEASLRRVLRHIAGDIGATQEMALPHFAIVTSWRGEPGNEERANARRRLLPEISASRWGCIRLIGSWLTDGDADLRELSDRSFFIPGDVGDLALESLFSVASHCRQDAVIYCGSETGHRVRLAVESQATGQWEIQQEWAHVRQQSAHNIAVALETLKHGLAAEAANESQSCPVPLETLFEDYVPTFQAIYQSVAIAPASLGVCWVEGRYSGVLTALHHVRHDPGYDGPRLKPPGGLMKRSRS